MDVAGFQIVYPELIVSYSRCSWFGKEIEYYDFINSEWCGISYGADALLFDEEFLSIEEIEGVIKPASILEVKDLALIYVKEANRSCIGVVRGKSLSNCDESLDCIITTSDNNFNSSQPFEYFNPEEEDF